MVSCFPASCRRMEEWEERSLWQSSDSRPRVVAATVSRTSSPDSGTRAKDLLDPEMRERTVGTMTMRTERSTRRLSD